MALAKLRPSVVVIIGVRLSLVVQVCSVVPNRSELLQYSSLSILVVRGASLGHLGGLICGSGLHCLGLLSLAL